MTINRHNYETFFLMYIDNELPDTEKKLVDEFVRENPDLEEELLMLQQSVVVPDTIVFDDKEALYKNQFDTSGLQEKLFLHLDNELSESESELLMERINSDDGLKKEWEILQQTKLISDELIVFADKEILYKKENGKVVAFPWMKLAVAAVFLGFIVWGGIAYLNNRGNSTDKITVKADKQSPDKTPAISDTASQVIVQTPQRLQPKEESTIARVAPANTPNIKKVNTVEKSIDKKKELSEEQALVKNRKTNNLPEPYFNNINNDNSNKISTATVLSEMKANNIDDSGNHVTKTRQPKTIEPDNSFATTASLPESSEENNDHIFFMDEEKVKKTKLGGFLRKAKRVFERNAKIKPGSTNIKVANLEFAIQ
ncbi:MAG: hypothetical protein ABIN67_09795 [Ferruginibacter sp.]